jgi:hypothetical protein
MRSRSWAVTFLASGKRAIDELHGSSGEKEEKDSWKLNG